MSIPTGYGQTDEYGLLYLQDGETLTEEGELGTAQAIERILATLLAALGPGVYSGGAGSISSGNVALTAIVAAAQDVTGVYPLSKAATTLAATLFQNGVSYVHLLAGETARQDGGSSYTITGSATPPAGAVLVTKVTKTAGTIAAVDDTVRAQLAITAELWTEVETLAAALTALTDRVAVLEGGGSAGEDPISWGALQKSYGIDGTTIAQEIAAAVLAHVTALHGDTGTETGGGTTTITVEPPDVDAVNQALALLQEIATDNAAAGDTQIDTFLLVPGVREEGVDWVNSTWTTGLTGPA